MLSFLKICLPVAAPTGAGAYIASDRSVLAQIGLAPGRGELQSLPAPRPHVPARAPSIRQGGPVCYDVPVWSSDAGPVSAWPGYVSPLYGQPGAFVGVPELGGGMEMLTDTPISVFPVDYNGGGVYDMVTQVVDTAAKPVTVPEPGSMALFLVGVSGLLVLKGSSV